MQEKTNFLSWIFASVAVFIKSSINKVRGIIYYRKCEKVMSEFKAYERDDVELKSLPVINFSDYPTLVDLNRYLREHYKKKYPEYIEVKCVEKRIILKLVSIGDSLLEHKRGILNLNNGSGKIYTYQEFVLDKAF